MTDRRVDYLLTRELDGELTPVEAAELKRALHTSPAQRRERHGWQEVTEQIGDRAVVQFSTRKMSAAIVRELPVRRRQALPARVMMTAAAAVLLLTFVSQPTSHRIEPKTKRMRVALRTTPAPVVVFVDEHQRTDTPEPVPVEIHF